MPNLRVEIARYVKANIKEEREACEDIVKGAIDVLGYDASAHAAVNYILRKIRERSEREASEEQG